MKEDISPHTGSGVFSMQNDLKIKPSFYYDKYLFIALLTGLLFCLYGIHWGRYESWDPDQMAFHNRFPELKFPFNPQGFQKPPFHLYVNFILCYVPLKTINKLFLHLSASDLNIVMLIWSRILIAGMFLGSIIIVYYITKRFYSIFAARAVAFIFSTSAGFISESHLLTTDIPVTFWMLLSFFFAVNVLLKGKTVDYLLAGFFAGIATATKYNGLAIGIAIPVAHIFHFSRIQWTKIIVNRNLILGLFTVAIGFVIANPYSLLDYHRFVTDFNINYTVAPVLGVNTSGNNYFGFIQRIVEIIGFPSFMIILVTCLYAIYLLFSKKILETEKKGILLFLVVFLIYYVKFGSFARLPRRFVLPIVPYFLMMSGPFWRKWNNNRKIIYIILILVVGYNIVCDYYVGSRFSNDPRMEAQVWVKENLQPGSSIETESYSTNLMKGGFCPSWNKIPGVQLNEINMPDFDGRNLLFREKFKSNNLILGTLDSVKEDGKKASWYSFEQLLARRPDYIAINSLEYKGFINGDKGKYYPSIKTYFINLLEEKYPYKIVFDRTSYQGPWWVYPKDILFLDNRMTIFKRNDIILKN